MVTYIGLDAANDIHSDAKGTEDTLYGLGGDDQLTATAHLTVFIYGGNGNDILIHDPFGTPGPFGDANIYGGAGDDRILSGPGSDQLFGDDGSDTIDALSGSDKIYGGPGADLLFGEIFLGSASGDSDVIYGGDGGDLLAGQLGADVLDGDHDNDILDGGPGKDLLTGGRGSDRFDFAVAPLVSNSDTVTDFSVAADTIAVDNFFFTEVGAVGVLLASRFFIGPHAHDANDRIIYNAVTGALLYDSNGSGPGRQVRFATLDDGLPLTNADFLVF